MVIDVLTKFTSAPGLAFSLYLDFCFFLNFLPQIDLRSHLFSTLIISQDLEWSSAFFLCVELPLVFNKESLTSPSCLMHKKTIYHILQTEANC